MDQRQYEAMLADAELRLRRLRTLYDHWFHGIERTEPQQQRGEVDRLIQELRRQPQRNTALRFRFNQLVQRYTTFNTYWQRIARQIEEGTYKRDVLRARQRVAATKQNPRDSQAPAEGPAGHDLDMDVDVDVDAALAALKTDPPPAGTTAPGAAAAAPSDSVDPARPASQPPTGERRSPPPRAITPFALPAQQTPVIKPPLQPAARPGVPPAVPAGVLRKPGTPAQPSGASAVPAGASRAPAPPPPAGALRAPGPPAGVLRAPAPPPASGNHAAAAHAGGGNGMSEDQIQRIYQRYVEARRQNSERTDNVRLETVAKTVRDQLPKLAEKHAGKSIDFEVVLKDGRVALKPVAK